MADKITNRLGEDGSIISTISTDIPICDFCCDTSRDVRWQFTVADSTIDSSPPTDGNNTNVVLRNGKVIAETHNKLTIESIGGRWAACDRCKKLVETKEQAALALIATKQYIANNSIFVPSSSQFYSLMHQIHDAQMAFWNNWDKEPAMPWGH